MASPLIVAGIDPGLSGGVAVLRDGVVIHADRLPVREFAVAGRRRRMTDGDTLAELLAEHRPAATYVEEAHARTSRGRRGKEGGEGGDSAPTAFSFGGNWSIAIDRAARWGLVVVGPRRWQRSMLVIRSPDREGTKAASIAFCRQFHPEADLAPGRLREPNDGIADAIAIAHFGWLQEQGVDKPPRTLRRPARRRA